MAERFEPEGLLRERRITDLHVIPGYALAVCAVEPCDGGEAPPLTALARGALQLCWRPNGQQLLVIGPATVAPDAGAAGCERSDGAEAEAPDRAAEGREHCTDSWMMELDEDGGPGEARRLSHGQDNAGAPSLPG